MSLVCKHCGGNSGFRERGTVRAQATRDTTKVERGDDGKLRVTWGWIDSDADFAEDMDVHTLECRDCLAEAARIEDLVADEWAAGIDLAPGDVVTLPDGLRAEVATVDRVENTFTVTGWHEVFQSGEATLHRRVAFV